MVRRKRNLFNPDSSEPFKLSRSKIEDFVRCPRCFYLDRRLGVGRPSIPGYTLNSAVDTLLKKEFDAHRLLGQPHPIMEAHRIKAVPFTHPELDTWRHNFTGVQYLHPQTNFLIYGAVDDLWLSSKGELIVVDYKSTSKLGEVSLEDKWKQSYKRQMEIYQWLLRRNNFKVQDTGYFVYANGQTDRAAFNAKLDFNMTLLPYNGSDKWVEKIILKAHKVLKSSKLPRITASCEHCSYREASAAVEQSTKKLLSI